VVLFAILTGNIFAQEESILFYRQRRGRGIRVSGIELSFFVNLYDGNISSFAIGSDNSSFVDLNERISVDSFRINLDLENFNSFKEALNRFLQWDSLARENNMTEPFRREVPINVISNSVTWSRWVTDFTRNTFEVHDFDFILSFNFRWTPSHIESYRGQFDIRSNTAVSDEVNIFRLIKNNMSVGEVERLLQNLADETIQAAIQQSRELERERERQRQLQDELFR